MHFYDVLNTTVEHAIKFNMRSWQLSGKITQTKKTGDTLGLSAVL